VDRTIAVMARPKNRAGESKKERTEPVRLDRDLMALIRLVAPSVGMSAPEWIEDRLRVIANKELDQISKRAEELRKRAQPPAD
jgi:hypothetical protein